MNKATRSDAAGNVHSIPYPKDYEVKSATETLNNDDMGKVIAIATDALVFTLPPVGDDVGAGEVPFGECVTFLNTGADGNNIITISPNANDAIFGTIANAAADSVSGGVVDKDWVNTKATANKGDFCTLMSDGVDGWYIVGGVGIWASEA